MIPTKTYPLSAIMGDQLTDKERIAELEARLKHCEGHAAELEAEVRALRLNAEREHGAALLQSHACSEAEMTKLKRSE